MSIGIWALAIVGVIASVAITLGVYFFATGEWLWDRDEAKADRRNWRP